MIKINLLPVKEKKKRKEFIIGFFVVLFLAVVLLGMFWIYIQRVRVRSDLKKEIAQIEEESKGYQEKINEMKDLEAKENSLETFRKTIKSISETQRKVVVAFDQLAANLPDGIWFTNVTQGKGADGNKFTIQGYALARSNLQDFLTNLQRPGSYFKEPVLSIKSINSAVGLNQQINQFEMNVKVTDQNS